MREEGIEPPTAGSGIQRSTTELFPQQIQKDKTHATTSQHTTNTHTHHATHATRQHATHTTQPITPSRASLSSPSSLWPCQGNRPRRLFPLPRSNSQLAIIAVSRSTAVAHMHALLTQQMCWWDAENTRERPRPFVLGCTQWRTHRCAFVSLSCARRRASTCSVLCMLVCARCGVLCVCCFVRFVCVYVCVFLCSAEPL